MNTSHRISLAGVAVALAVSAVGCATTPIPADKLTRSQSAITSAETLNAQRDPNAALHLTLAKDELAEGKKLLKEAENERAGFVLQRAEADAIAARELARAKSSQIELAKTKETVEGQKAALGENAQ